MKKFSTYILFILSCLPGCAYAQISQYSEQHYTTAEGLPSNFIHDAKWDDNGFIWISASRGISRFDGTWMEIYNTESKPSLYADYCTPIIKDDQQHNIFCDERGYIYEFSGNKPVLKDSSHAVSGKANYMTIMLPHQFWDSLFPKINSLYQVYNEPIVIDSTKFLVTDNDKLLVYNLNKHGYDVVKQFSSSLKLFKANDRIFIYEKNRSLYEIRNGDFINITSAPANFDVNGSDVFWRNGMNEAILVENKKSYLLRINDNSIIKGKQICDQLPDFISINNINYDSASATMAIATDGNGLYLYKPKMLMTYQNHSADIRFSVKSYGSQVQLEPGSLLLSSGVKLNFGNNNFCPDKTLPDFINSYKVKDSVVLIQARDGYVWTYSYTRHTLYKYFDSHSPVAGAFAMIDGQLFFTNNEGIFELKETGANIIYEFPLAIASSDQIAIDMVQTKPGYLVFGGCHGVYGFDIYKKTIDTLVKETKGLCTRGIAVYKDYLLFATYGKGLWIYQNNKLVQLHADDRQLLLHSHNVVIDQFDNAWIGTNSGIFHTSVHDIIRSFENSIPVAYEFFGKNEGMDISELNGGSQSSVYRLNDDRLSYAGINGVVAVAINNLRTGNENNRLFFDRIIVNDSIYIQLPESGNIILSPRTKRIRLYFTLPGRNDYDPVLLSYRIGGIVSKWESINFSRQNFIDINGLPAGDYTIEFNFRQASSPNLVYFKFRIEAPWYKTWTFFIWLSVLGLLLIALFFRGRNRQLIARNKQLASKVDIHLQDIITQRTELEKQVGEMEEYQQKLEEDYALKNRLISIIGHDIITPLRFMNRAGSMLMANKNKISSETFDDTLKTIRETGNSLEDMATNMLNWIKNHQDNMHFTISDFDISAQVYSVIQSVNPTAEFKSITIFNGIPKGIILHQFRDPLKTILQQVLMNAVKYSEKGTIMIQLTEKETEMELSVKDEGTGMPAELVTHLMDIKGKDDFNSLHEKRGLGFGFVIIRDMLKIIRGTFTISSRENEGTTIALFFPREISAE